MAVFVLDKRKKPLMPFSEKRARKLLGSGRARVHRLVPFVIRITDLEVSGCTVQPVRVKLDPGSKFTGIAVVREAKIIDVETGEMKVSVAVLNLFQLQHRGRQISEALTARRGHRRFRRSSLRYRPARFNNRTKPKGWLAPSLQHRVDTTVTWVKRLRDWCPVSSIAQELVRFDMQSIDNPEISGIEYQQGTLQGYEVREYLLEKWGRKCAYCSAEHTPLNIDHIRPKAKGGSNRVSNLTLACVPCNQKKGARDVDEFLAHDPKRLERILAQSKRPLKDAAAVNATRWALHQRLKATGLPVSVASGGKTKFNRHVLSIPKSHALDAACVGSVSTVTGWQKPTLAIKATGRGSYQRTRLDAFGFPRGYLMRSKSAFGFQTGDMVKASVPTGKKTGVHTGRVAVRASGSFNIQTGDGMVQGISHRHCRVIQRGDGYGYSRLSTQGKNNFPLTSHNLPAIAPEGRLGYLAEIW